MQTWQNSCAHIPSSPPSLWKVASVLGMFFAGCVAIVIIGVLN